MVQFWTAFLGAQMSMRDPCKDASNPHFRSKFVSLKGVADAVRPALHSRNIVVTQLIDYDDAGTFVRTVLAHTGGGSIESRCPVVTTKQNDPQAMGSAITYARRYALAAICGVAPSDDDDDAEAAVDRTPAKRRPKAAAPPKPAPFDSVEHALEALGRCVDQGSLDIFSPRVRASGFTGIDLDNLREAMMEHRAKLLEGK
tara:strand:- start:371 stop:970 length:600 start_codon:yes stop_codon:yes gene_type:complete